MQKEKTMNQELGAVWETLELTLSGMDQGEVDWMMAAEMVAGILSLLLTHTPREIADKVINSRFSSQGMISWIVHESSQIRDIPAQSVTGLRNYWNAEYGQTIGAVLSAGRPRML